MKLILSEEVRKFAEQIVPYFNAALKSAMLFPTGTSKADVELTEQEFAEIAILLFASESKYDDYLRKMAGSVKFTDKDLEDVVSNIKTKGDDISKGDEKLVENILKNSSLLETREPDYKIVRKISSNLSEKLNDKWREEFNQPESGELQIWEIIAFYFLHSFGDRILGNEPKGGKEVECYVGNIDNCRQLDSILDKYNLAIIQGNHKTGKTQLAYWYARQRQQKVLRMDWKENQELGKLLLSIPLREKTIMERCQFEMNIYWEENNIDDIKKRFSTITVPENFILIIDNFNGTEAFLRELSEFINCNCIEQKMRVIVLTTGEYQFFAQTLKIDYPKSDEMKKIFEKYSETTLADDMELEQLVNQLVLETAWQPRLLILFAESYRQHRQLKQENVGKAVLKGYSLHYKEKQDNHSELSFNSVLDRHDLKLEGHIRSLSEPCRMKIK